MLGPGPCGDGAVELRLGLGLGLGLRLGLRLRLQEEHRAGDASQLRPRGHRPACACTSVHRITGRINTRPPLLRLLLLLNGPLVNGPLVNGCCCCW